MLEPALYPTGSLVVAALPYPVRKRRRTNWRNTRAYREWRDAVKERDVWCVLCGSEEDLDAHHIIPAARIPTLRFDVDNGETLCGECHRQEHPEIPDRLF